MSSALHALCLAAQDPAQLATFWAQLLERQAADAGAGRFDLMPHAEKDFRFSFLPGGTEKQGRNLIHLDLTNTTEQAQQEKVGHTLELGGRHADVGQRGDEGHVVLADPEGNEFCEVEAGNGFLADTGRIGAVNCDGTQRLGYFWSAALGWPLVWDQDEETAIQSPRGGSKITWSGPPLLPRTMADRWRFELTITDGDHDAERERLQELGATPVADDDQLLRDPDGNVFRLLA